MDARAVAEDAARASYGRLLAYLCARTRDVAQAEDALADAFRAAIETWPVNGAPDRPEAWLLTVARRKLTDAARRTRTQTESEAELTRAADEAADAAGRDDPFPDERLKLLFVCAHPAIDSGARTPLMLQTVLGLDAARIASAFLVSPAAMGQRLVRAKRKIAAAGVPFATPACEDLAARLADVLNTIYAAYGTAWDDPHGGAHDGAGRSDLSAEAIWLARLAGGLAPNEPEALGLLALLLHCEARRDARRDADGRYTPLSEQNVALWSRPMIAEAEEALLRANAMQRPGRFQIEAAIQSAHAHGRLWGAPVAEALAALYDRLAEIAPSIGALVSRASAISAVRGPDAGLAALDAMAADAGARISGYQPYWAVRAHLLAEANKREEARQAYARAAGLAEDGAVRAFLLSRMQAL